MTSYEFGRAPVNELASLVERLQPNALNRILHAYPQFEKELKRGPSAGLGDSQDDREYYASRARLALDLSKAAVDSVQEKANQIVTWFNRLQGTRTVTAIAGAVAGGTTLVSLGVPDIIAPRISSAATAIIAVLTAAADALARRYSATHAEKAHEIKHAALTLEQFRTELALMVEHRRSLADIVAAIEQCNRYALELNLRRKDLLLI